MAPPIKFARAVAPIVPRLGAKYFTQGAKIGVDICQRKRYSK